MACSRCGGELEIYELDGEKESVCRECGFVDVSVRHEPDHYNDQSWTEAFDWFYEHESDMSVDELIRQKESED